MYTISEIFIKHVRGKDIQMVKKSEKQKKRSRIGKWLAVMLIGVVLVIGTTGGLVHFGIIELPFMKSVIDRFQNKDEDGVIYEMASRMVDAVNQNDLEEINKQLFYTQESLENEEVMALYESDRGDGNGIIGEIIKQDSMKLIAVEEDVVYYEITHPQLGTMLQDLKLNDLTEEEVVKAIFSYVKKAKKITEEVEISYCYEDGLFSADYKSEEFVNALTGNMLISYQKLMQEMITEFKEGEEG